MAPPPPASPPSTSPSSVPPREPAPPARPEWGAHSFGFVWHCDAEAALDAIGGAGFRQVQLMATPPHFDPWRQDAGRTRRLDAMLRRHGLSLLALDLASGDVNLASPAGDVVDFAVDAYVRAIGHGADLGARWICVGSGRRPGLLAPAMLAQALPRLTDGFRAAFARIRAEAARRGLGVILENHPQGLLADAGGIESFLAAEGDDGIRVVYDVANAAAIGEDPLHGLELLWPRIAAIHLSDSPKGQWRHDPIGSGDIDFTAIAGLLRARGFSGALVLEILSARPLAGLVEGAAALGAALGAAGLQAENGPGRVAAAPTA